mmetsp:Transcript_965/g.2322  ORF Transcript_965/g.2322 Transcript_965/m.2322 type:complete len:234 (-) Transcript_965:384-1085(-)
MLDGQAADQFNGVNITRRGFCICNPSRGTASSSPMPGVVFLFFLFSGWSLVADFYRLTCLPPIVVCHGGGEGLQDALRFGHQSIPRCGFSSRQRRGRRLLAAAYILTTTATQDFGLERGCLGQSSREGWQKNRSAWGALGTLLDSSVGNASSMPTLTVRSTAQSNLIALVAAASASAPAATTSAASSLLPVGNFPFLLVLFNEEGIARLIAVISPMDSITLRTSYSHVPKAMV